MNILNQIKDMARKSSKSAIISLRVTPEVNQSIKEYADRKGESVTDVLIHALTTQIERENLVLDYKLKHSEQYAEERREFDDKE
jgi:hypothetical protein